MSTSQISAKSSPTDRKQHAPQRVPTASKRYSPRRQWAARHAVRLVDLVFAGLLIGLLIVPMLLIALLIKLTSHGPAIYKQQRTGQGGRPFTMYKFRTMRVDAEAETGPVWAKRDDPRRTAIGILLRRTSLDELPQFFNVLKGDMSLVGPRPERPCFVQQFEKRIPAYNQRHQVLPGITGWAQVNGWRGDSSIEKRLEHDLFYVNNRSLAFNLRIMLLTPARVFFERNAV